MKTRRQDMPAWREVCDSVIQPSPMSENAALLEREFSVLEFNGFPLNVGGGQAYHEEAFHHFLEMERKRAEASNRPFLLLLVDFKRRVGPNTLIGAVSDSTVFSALSGCL